MYHRLKKPAEFSRVFRNGKTFGDRFLLVLVYRAEREEYRIGFAAQRLARTAVNRNRIRRRLRALFSDVQDKVHPCGDLVILGKKTVLNAEWPVLQRSLRRLLKQAGCMK